MIFCRGVTHPQLHGKLHEIAGTPVIQYPAVGKEVRAACSTTVKHGDDKQHEETSIFTNT